MDDELFFDREREMQELLTFLEVGAMPNMIVLIGPANSGKSALLHRLHSLWEADQRLKTTMPVFYLDMRLADVHTPALAAAKIANQLRTWLSWFWKLGTAAATSLKITFKGVSSDAMSLASVLKKEPQSDLASVMAAFTGLAYADSNIRPVFIIDDVDKLKRWDDKDLDILLQGFVAMTKQDHRAVVIMSTSDDFFRQWFQGHVHSSQWTPLGVGHFSKELARQLYCRLLREREVQQPDVTDEEWERIYAVCGGSPLDLANLVTGVFKRGKQMEAVLDGMVDAAKTSVETGAQAIKGELGWDGAKFKSVARLILQNNGAVGIRTVYRKAFGGDVNEARAQLQAMLKANVIHVRYAPADVFYDDLHRGNDKSKDFVMAVSPPQLVAMREYLEEEDQEEALP